MKTTIKTKEHQFKIGDKVSFLRQVVGYPNKILQGVIVGFNTRENIGVPKLSFPVAHIKAKCEYGSALPYNHTLALTELTPILKP
jgi:hypothetical protein